MPLVGEKMRLFYQAPVNRGDLHIRATVRDGDDLLLGISPVTLIHVGQGLYTNNDNLFPNVDIIKATMEIFKDAGFSQSFKSRFSSTIQTIEKGLVSSTGDAFITTSVNDTIVGITEDEESILTAVLEEVTGEEIIGILESPEDLVAEIEDQDEITGTLDDSDDSITGELGE
jgi:hypothetical protein